MQNAIGKKTVVITGGNSGIGLSLTKQYLSEGHNVAVISRSINELRTLSEEHPNTLLSYAGDISNLETIENFYHICKKTFSGIDILVANAGVANAIDLSSVSLEEFNTTFDTNVRGLFFCLQKSLIHLNKDASITVVSSIQSNKGAGSWAIYGASKAAVRSLARSFAAELGPRNIRVNCVSPGVTKTPIFSKFGIDEKSLETILSSVEESTPLKRLGTPDEIASAIVFLNSPSSSFITGVDLQVDGGLIQV